MVLVRHAWIGTVLLLLSCTSTPIEVRDSGVFQTGGRLLVRFDEPEEGRVWSGLLIEADWFEGEDEQGLAVGESVELDEVTFLGPDTLAIEYSMRRECVAYTFGAIRTDIGFEMNLELGYARVVSELELADATQRAKEGDTWDGFHLGSGLLWTPTDWIGFEGRLTALADFDDLGNEFQTIELGTRLFPRWPVALFAGWRWVDQYRASDESSDLDLRSNGPMVALRVTL